MAMVLDCQFLQPGTQQHFGLLGLGLLQIPIKPCSGDPCQLALLFHGQTFPFERERRFDAAVNLLPPSLVGLAAAPLTCSKVRLKKSISNCFCPSKRSSSAIRNSDALGKRGATALGALDLLPGARPGRRSSAAFPPAASVMNPKSETRPGGQNW